MEKTCIGSIPVIPPCEDYPVTFEVVETVSLHVLMLYIRNTRVTRGRHTRKDI